MPQAGQEATTTDKPITKCHRYRNYHVMAINMLVEKLYREVEVGLWICGEVLLAGLICT